MAFSRQINLEVLATKTGEKEKMRIFTVFLSIFALSAAQFGKSSGFPGDVYKVTS